MFPQKILIESPRESLTQPWRKGGGRERERRGWLILENFDPFVRSTKPPKRILDLKLELGGAGACEYQPSAAICEPLAEQSWELRLVQRGLQ